MRNITEVIQEHLANVAAKAEELEIVTIEEGTISSEEDFRTAAKAKFEKAFGDDLDEKKMNDTIDGILKDNEDLVKDGKWGDLMGILNKSFTK
jgi:hypothetical protein